MRRAPAKSGWIRRTEEWNMSILARIRFGGRNRRRNGESGQSLAETSLVFPMLITIVVGAVNLAQVAYTSIEVANAAKAGAQYGCQNGFTAADTTGIKTAASAEAVDVTLTTTPSITCVCSDGTTSTCANSDCTNSHIEETLTVNTSATITPSIHLPLLPKTWTVKGTASQRVEQ
jgi:Flp pilus assembly protein TadG